MAEMWHTSRFQMSYTLNKPWRFVLQQPFDSFFKEALFSMAKLCICVPLGQRRQTIIN